MPLTGQAKTDYQREYMRRRRSNQRSNVTPESVRPSTQHSVRPKVMLGEIDGVVPFREECITCEHLRGDENDRSVCAAVDGCVYDEGLMDIETLTKIDKTCGDKLNHGKPEPQSYNPMMVGYVPPTD